MDEDDPMTWDLYGIVGDGTIGIDSSIKDIQRAYKKKALKVHPDKNRDNPDAARLFDRLQKAYEILLDDQKRLAFINRQKAKLERKKREAQDDAATVLAKQRLQQREKEAMAAHFARNQEKEEKRAQRENAEVLAELRRQQRRFAKHTQSSVRNFVAAAATESKESQLATVQVSWRPLKKRRTDSAGSSGVDPSEPTEQMLRSQFGVYGDIASLIVKPSKHKAYIVFTSPEAALAAVEHGPAGASSGGIFDGLTVTLHGAQKTPNAAAPASAPDPSRFTAPPPSSSSSQPAFSPSSAATAGPFPASSTAPATAAAAAANLDSFEADILTRMAAMAAKKKAQAAAAAPTETST